jgi:hypothetical protein
MSYWTAHAVFLSRRAVRRALFSSDTFSTSSHLFWGFHRAEKYIVRSPRPTPHVGELFGGENQSEKFEMCLLIIRLLHSDVCGVTPPLTWAVVEFFNLDRGRPIFSGKGPYPLLWPG